ncbi:hypothetical protein E4T39_02714 [Aureobasidium subglaciale]|nr:hypothetical protein E4T39_02714 [Aureobasidium subglaciale]
MPLLGAIGIQHALGVAVAFYLATWNAIWSNDGTVDRYQALNETHVKHSPVIIAPAENKPTSSLWMPGNDLVHDWSPNTDLPTFHHTQTVTITATPGGVYRNKPQIIHQGFAEHIAEKYKNDHDLKVVSILWSKFLDDTRVGRGLTWVVCGILHDPMVHDAAYLVYSTPFIQVPLWLARYIFYLWSLMPWIAHSAIIDIFCVLFVCFYAVAGSRWACRLLARYLGDKSDPPDNHPLSPASSPPNGGGGGGGNPPSNPLGPPPNSGPSGPQAPPGNAPPASTGGNNGSDATEALAAAAEREQAAQKEIEELQRKLAEATASIKSQEDLAQKKSEKLQAELEKAKKQEEAAHKQFEELKVELAKVKKEEQATQTEYKKLEDQLADAQRTITARDKTIRDRDEAITSRDKTNATLDNNNFGLQFDYDHTDKQLEELKRIHKETLDKHKIVEEKCKATIEGLKAHIEALKGERNADTTGRDADVDRIRADHQTEIERIQNEQTNAIEQLEAEHKKEIERLRAESNFEPAVTTIHIEERQKLENALTQAQTGRAAAEAQLTQHEEACQKNVNAAVAQAYAKKNREHDYLKRDMSVMQDKHRARVTELERQLAAGSVPTPAPAPAPIPSPTSTQSDSAYVASLLKQIKEKTEREEAVAKEKGQLEDTLRKKLEQEEAAAKEKEKLKTEAQVMLQRFNDLKLKTPERNQGRDLVETQVSNRGLTAENAALRKQLLEQQHRVQQVEATATAEIQSRDDQITTLRSTNNDGNNAFLQQQTDVDAVRDALQKDLDQARAELEQTNKQAREIDGDQKRKIEDLGETVTDAEEAAEILRARITVLETEQAEAVTLIGRLQTEGRDRIDEQDATIQQLQGQIDVLGHTISSNNFDNTHRMKVAEVQYNALMAENEELKKNAQASKENKPVTETEQAVEDCRRRLEEEKARSLRLEHEKNTAEKNYQSQSRDYMKAQDDVRDLKERLRQAPRSTGTLALPSPRNSSQDADTNMGDAPQSSAHEKNTVSREEHNRSIGYGRSLEVKIDELQGDVDNQKAYIEGQKHSIEVLKKMQGEQRQDFAELEKAKEELQLEFDTWTLMHAQLNATNETPAKPEDQPNPYSLTNPQLSVPNPSLPPTSGLGDVPHFPAPGPPGPLLESSQGPRRILKPKTRNPNRSPQRVNGGESEDPAQDILDWVLIRLQTSNFGGGALGNAPSFSPPAKNADNSPFSANISSSPKTRDEERAEAAVRQASEQAAALDEADHLSRLEQGARWTEELQQGQREYEAAGRAMINADPPIADRTEDMEMDTEDVYQGTPPRNLVEGSEEEIALLRSLPENETALFDQLYRDYNYGEPDDFDEYGEPIWYNE